MLIIEMLNLFIYNEELSFQSNVSMIICHSEYVGSRWILKKYDTFISSEHPKKFAENHTYLL